MKNQPSRESKMVSIKLSDGSAGNCDPEIQTLVQALNDGGFQTIASCSGHGHRPAVITLNDGRNLLVLRSFDEYLMLDGFWRNTHGEIAWRRIGYNIIALGKRIFENAKYRNYYYRRDMRWRIFMEKENIMFTNPTGGEIRGDDVQGSGYFGAPRGDHKHSGVDYVATLNQPIVAIMSGTVTKIGYAYGDDLSFRYIQIENKEAGYRVRQFYVDPDAAIHVSAEVTQGQNIGLSQNLGDRYKGITEHCHVSIWLNEELQDPTHFIA